MLRLSGNWRIDTDPPLAEIQTELEADPAPKAVVFDTLGLSGWDSGLLAFLVSLTRICGEKKIPVREDTLPEGIRRLLALASAVPERKDAGQGNGPSPLPARVGGSVLAAWLSTLAAIGFVGDVTLSFLRMAAGKARFRPSDLMLILQECGAEALPIVSLISLLVGLILAFIGAIQLKLFGAQLYVADLVGIAMVRAMGAVMAGIIMAGRTGAAFAAQIGTMQVNEEIDALKTAGIPPVDFLVLPRVLALTVMMPLLTIYADLLGIIGGLIVAVTGLDLSVIEYWNRTQAAISLANVGIGVFSGFIFGALIALAGCFRGMQCGRSASAVGDATRSAVVTGIVGIVVAQAILTVVFDVLGI